MARQWLLAGSCSGEVASVFREGFQARFQRPPGEQAWLVFHTLGVPSHPWSVGRSGWPPVQAGQSMAAHGLDLEFPSGEHVDLTDAEICDLGIKPWTAEEAARARDWALRHRDGWEACHGAFGFSRLLDVERIQKAGGSVQDAVSLATKLAGWGDGSTPCGDDYLVGRLAAWHALKLARPSAREQLDLLRAAMPTLGLSQRTPLGSAQMILAAVDGSFPASVRALVQCLTEGAETKIQESTGLLLGQGGSSGRACLLGLVDGVLHRHHGSAAGGSI